jgi:hypothetical protein
MSAACRKSAAVTWSARDLGEALAGARRRQGMEFAAGLGHRERPGHGDRYHLLGEHDQGVSGLNRLVALRGVVGIAGAREGVMAPGLEGESVRCRSA